MTSQEQAVADTTALLANPTVRELSDKFMPIWALGTSGALLGWDLEVNMPEKGAVSRGRILSQLALLRQKHMSEVYPLLDKARELCDLNDHERGVVRVLERSRKFFTRIPPSLLEEEERTAAEASVVWREARKNSDFNSFRPYLEKMVGLKKLEAEKLGYEKHPYDALLDQYEEGLTVQDVDSMYSNLIQASKRILEKVRSDEGIMSSHPLEKKRYDVEAMTRVNNKILEILGMPRDRFRMDVSTHPFTSGTSRDDVRITTRYEGVDFRASVYSTIHECGHAIYELGLNEDLEYTPIGAAASYGVHESQSRFWENVVGRSRTFVGLLEPTLKENLSFVAEYDKEELYRYFNLVRPGPIRVDADELTYNFHTALRYELEKELISSDLDVADLPSIWNDTIRDFLGVSPKNDAEGVLQDVHWSGGGFGYFPTYTLGNIIAGMIWYRVREDVNLEQSIMKGDFAPLKTWLYEKIHRWGSTYAPKELAKRSLGETYNPDRFVQYLEWKYPS